MKSILGVSAVVSILIGFLISGFAISKFKPRESYLLLFNIFIALVYMIGEFAFLFMGCSGSITQDMTGSDKCVFSIKHTNIHKNISLNFIHIVNCQVINELSLFICTFMLSLG